MIYFNKFILLVHVLSAMIWLGGMFFLSLVLFPAINKLESSVTKRQLISITAKRFRKISWACILLLLITGTLNVMNLGITSDMLFSRAFISSRLGSILISKICLVIVMILLSASHDYFLGPRYSKLQENNIEGKYSIELAGRRKLTSRLARLNVIVAVLVVACAVMLS